jgi:hypothetical protein
MHPPQPCKTYILPISEATGVCIPIGSSEILGAAVYKSPGRAWSDADITEIVSLQVIRMLNIHFGNPSGEKQPVLFEMHEFEISAPHCPAHYSAARNGDVPDIVVHKNIRLSDSTASDILDSDHST